MKLGIISLTNLTILVCLAALAAWRFIKKGERQGLNNELQTPRSDSRTQVCAVLRKCETVAMGMSLAVTWLLLAYPFRHVHMDFFYLWSVLPYVLFILLRRMIRPLPPSRLFSWSSCILAVFTLAATVYLYLKAVIVQPNHNSGMVFVILPFYLIIGIVAALVLVRLLAGWIASKRYH